MPPLTPELETYILTQIEGLFFDVTAFTNEINKQVTLMTGNGLSQAQISKVLSNDLKNGGRIFGQLKNSTKAKVVQTVNQSSRIGQESEYSGNDMFAWVTVGGHKVCMDCDGRAGLVMTYDQWETEGVPGSGWSVCQGYCYCVLDPSGKVVKNVKVDTTKIKPEKGASIKPPLKKKNILEKVFQSKNTKVNNLFIDSMQQSPSKFKEFISKFPSLRLIANANTTSHFNNTGWSGIWEQWMGGKLDAAYLRIRGAINIQHLGSRRIFATIRHEYGHWLHHNLHYRGYTFDDMRDLLKVYKPLRKSTGSISEAVKALGYAEGSGGHKSLVEYMKFFEAAKKDAKIMLKLGKGRYSPEIGKVRDFYDDIWRMHNSSSKKFLSAKNKALLTDDFINAIIQDGAAGTQNTLNLMDTIGALTKNQVGFGHSVNYYTKGGMPMQLHEVFANLTSLYAHENPAWWAFVEKNLPELAKYYNSVMDDVIKNGFYGASI